MGQLGETFAVHSRLGIGLAQQLLGEIDPAGFATKIRAGADVIDAVHPAFAVGHLAIYPPRLLEILGQDASQVVVPSGWAELFEAGKDCVDDPECAVYPEKDQIVDVFTTGYSVVAEVLPGVSDEVMAEPFLRDGKPVDRFPTKGALAGFLVGAHMFMHLGQVSTWRRCFGLGPAM